MSRTTLLLSLFVFLVALPSLHATAILSHGRHAIPHRALAGRRSTPQSRSASPIAKRARCKAKSAGLSSSTATATVQAVNVDTTKAAQATTSTTKVAATTTVAAATTETAAAETTHKTPTTQQTTQAQTTKEAPTTTTHKPTTTQQTTAPAHTTTKASGSSGSSGSSAVSSYFAGVNTGDGTYYNTGLDACGLTDSDSSSFIAAVSIDLFDNYPGYTGGNPNNNPMCNRQVKATYQGKSVTVRVVDRCTGCASQDLDFSPLAFQELAPLAVGRLTGMTWEWV
ncbi:RlpA-like double-psi beta-barrel-protein domain-containing protein-containing protein [Mycena alexandri]|uniref:RlpA-like double-psi beta-barrel-protein domain-containing protein-containing protein n=1 Tax=Mycena alexandri TaxID=1745969 RepID=A0AAD6X664_9AGAR|nr:RlpA-like double-psi beta-barrel-protein domain-containing protein-containing protein [Mycena alexandri]